MDLGLETPAVVIVEATQDAQEDILTSCLHPVLQLGISQIFEAQLDIFDSKGDWGQTRPDRLAGVATRTDVRLASCTCNDVLERDSTSIRDR